MDIRFAITVVVFGMGVQGSRQQVNDHVKAKIAQGQRYLFTPLEAYVGGKCLDGSPAGYFWSPPANDTNTMWVIYLKGGGGCSKQGSCEDFITKPEGEGRGTSDWWPATKDLGEEHDYMSNDCGVNPYFCNAHHVYIPMCAGDKHIGQNTNGESLGGHSDVAPGGFFFDGHTNLELIIDDIFKRQPIAAPQIQKALLMGTSAGGRGVVVNCDFFQDRLLAKGASAANVMCHPITSWKPRNLPSEIAKGADYQAPTPYDLWREGEVRIPEYPEWGNDLKKKFLPEACVSLYNKSYCDKTVNIFPLIQRAVFVAQDLIDTTVRGASSRQACSRQTIILMT